MRSLRFLFGTNTVIARIQRAGIHAKEREIAHERIVQDLEGERGERLRIVGLARAAARRARSGL